MSALDDKPFPRGPLIAAGLLVAASLLTVGGARLGLIGAPAQAPSTATAEMVRELRFRDRDDGGVIVMAGTRQTVIEPNSGGFVRGVVRGLARDRRARGIGQEPPFRLTRWSDGRLTLEDSATGQRLDLNGFGPTNRQAFLDLMAATGEAA